MAGEKRLKTKIKRRSAGLVITPPQPRRVEADHPAKLLFKEAIESARSIAEGEAKDEGLVEEMPPPPLMASAAEEVDATTENHNPLRIFKELKGGTVAKERGPVPAVQEQSLSIQPNDSFEDHFKQWKPFLPEAQMYVLEALFKMTHAVGSDRCLTSMPKLAAAAGVSERQTYNVVRELENHGFIERTETFNTPTKKGTVFRLHLTRRGSHPNADRRHHVGD